MGEGILSVNNDNDFNNDHSDIQAEIDRIHQEFKNILAKCEELVKKLGKAFEKDHPNKKEDICEEIKKELCEEIAEGLISRRNIERYCPKEWKKKTKPEKEKNDKLSFSQQKQEAIPQLLIGTDGNSVVEPASIPASDSNSNDAIDSEGSVKEGANYTEEYAVGNALEDVDLQQLISKQTEVEELQTETKEIEIEPDTKSNEINQFQSQEERDLNARPNIDQEDKSFEAEFQLPYGTLYNHLYAFWNKHVKSISFIAKADFVTKSITNVQIERTDGEFEPIN